MDSLRRDIRQALKLLLKERTFASTVLATLAVCIGANVAIFSVIQTVLLDPLPFADPDRIVTVYNSYPAAGANRGGAGTVDFDQRRANVAAFEEVALVTGSGSTVGEPGSTERVSTARVTPSLFPLLGVEAMVGRTFTEEEMERGNARKVLLTHGFWQEHFGGAADVTGRDLRVDGESYAVVGVLPESFSFPGREDVRFFVPVAMGPEDVQMERWHSNNFGMVARLAPGVTVAQAEAQNAALNDALMDRWPIPNARQLLEDAGYQTVIIPLADDLVRDVRSLLYLLWAGVGFVLLIGCVNIANLMLARAQTRVGQVATQLALGASRTRVGRQILTESLVLGVLGGALGLGLGALGIRFLLSLGAAELPRGTEIAVDVPVVAFTLLLSVVAAALFAGIPAAQVLKRDLSTVFRTESRTGTASRKTVLLRNGLVTSQVSLAFVMLIGAGLMFVSFREALAVDPGFEPDGLVTGFVSLPSARYADDDARRRFFDEYLAQARAIPGAVSVAATSSVPFSGNASSSVIVPEGYVPAPGESLISPIQTDASPGYFATMGIEVLEGREFLESDGPDALNVIVIDEWLANRYWPDRSPIGDRMIFGAAPGIEEVPEESLFTIVGVVENVKHSDLTTPDSEHRGAYYFSYRQRPRSFMTLVARAQTGSGAELAPALRQLLARTDGELPLFGVRTMSERVDESLLQRRIPLVLLGIFGAVALFLALIGIYGALAYSVNQRRKEIGIRLAMGSAPADVFRQVVGQGARVTGLGLVLGGVAAWFLARLVESLLFGVQATDPRVMGVVAGVLLLVGILACVVPARRATKVSPVEALGS